MARATGAVALLLLLGCEAIDRGEVRGPAAGDAGPLATWDASPGSVAADDAAPTVVLAVEASPTEAIVFARVSDDRGAVAAEAFAGLSGPYAGVPEGSGFALRIPLPPAGPVELVVRVVDAGGRVGEAHHRIERPAGVSARPPTLIVDPLPESTRAETVILSGRAEHPDGLQRVEIEGIVGGAFGPARTADHFARWSLAVPLAPGVTETLVVRAVSVAGTSTQVIVEVASRRPPPHGPPTLRVWPEDGARLETLRPEIALEPTGNIALSRVEVRVGRGPWQRARPVEGGFGAALRLVPGENTIEVLAQDVDGLVARQTVRWVADDGFGDGPRVVLRPSRGPGGRVVLDVDRAGVGALFPPDVQATTTLLYLDPRPLVTGALAGIRTGCFWDAEGPACPASWGQAERNLWKLLGLTPAGTEVAGTRLEVAASLTEELLALPFGVVLAEALGLGPDDLVLPEAPLVEAVVSRVMASHPAATADGRLPITLADGLADMATLSARFGPQGDHPGFLAGRSQSRVLTEDFRMRLVVDSNIALREGVDVDGAKRWLAEVGPGVPVLDLEFLDPGRFDLVGLADGARVDFEFTLAGVGRPLAVAQRADPLPRGDGEVWDVPAWTLEHLVAEAAFQAFGALRAGCDLCAGWPDALLYRNANDSVDLAEITIGRMGYDCLPGEPCGRRIPTLVGEPEHFDRFDGFDCATVDDCAFGLRCHRGGRIDDRGVCVDPADVECEIDADCGLWMCLGGTCVDRRAVECGRTSHCRSGEMCHRGHCRTVPAGWFRVWMPENIGDLSPTYLWDLVLDVVQARMQDGGVPLEGLAVRFPLAGVPVGLSADALEAQVRETLQTQREALAAALLGSVVDRRERVDLSVDRAADGAAWLVLEPCPLPVGCGAAPGDGLFDADGNRLDRPGPGGRHGLPVAELHDRILYLYRGDTRVRVEAWVTGEEVTLWLRRPG